MTVYTIDDVYGDQRPNAPSSTVVTYLPGPTVNQWDPVGGTCPAPKCGAGAGFNPPIDASKVHSGTWHTVTMNPGEPVTTITLTFTGTSPTSHGWGAVRNQNSGTQITVYCLLPPDLGQYITSYMNMTFTLDGQPVGNYQRTTNTQDWVYNAAVFTSETFASAEHTLVIEPQPGTDSSFLAFDYASYE